jgi:NitT/TauT family transport system substrate-binding protein
MTQHTGTPRPRRRWLRRAGVALVALVPLLAAACGSTAPSGSASATPSTSAATPSTSGAPVTLRLGYFPNLTHASALVGLQEGIFARDLGSKVTLQTSTYTAGPAELLAILSGAIDAGYMGPNPAITGYVQSHGEALRVISGATSGGAGLVVKPNINSAADLKGKTVASPQLGNTQDVALRHWLASKGLHTDTAGGGDVNVQPFPAGNSFIVQAFEAGQLAGAWVPEPYLSQIEQAGGKLLVNESTLWPGNQFSTTMLVVSTTFLTQHPDVVKRLLEAQVDSTDFIKANPAKSQADADAAIASVTGKPLKAGLVAAAWADMTFTDDPVASALITDAQRAEQLGFVKQLPSLTKLFDLGPLDQVLKAHNEPAVSS